MPATRIVSPQYSLSHVSVIFSISHCVPLSPSLSSPSSIPLLPSIPPPFLPSSIPLSPSLPPLSPPSPGVCLLGRDEGEPCNGEEGSPGDLSYYYNSEEGECDTLMYRGCGGNDNRFESGPLCLRMCDPSSEEGREEGGREGE